VKIVFLAYLRQKLSDFHQNDHLPILRIVEYISPVELRQMPRFVIFVWKYPGGLHVADAARPCTSLYIL